MERPAGIEPAARVGFVRASCIARRCSNICASSTRALPPTPLAEYEEIYHEYFYAHCDQIVADENGVAIPAEMTALAAQE